MGTTLILGSRCGGGFSETAQVTWGETSDNIEVVVATTYTPATTRPESSRRSTSG